MHADHQFNPGGELLIGCGHNRKKGMALNYADGTSGSKEWTRLSTLDVDPSCEPDYVWDLNHLPYPFVDNCFSEIHAYEVLEHCGTQGDYRFFFAQFEEFWRILKPDGLLYATVPMWDSMWAWGDPGHTRVITKGSLIFLCQDMYERDLGKTPMTDYRRWYKADYEVMSADDSTERFLFVLRAKK